MSGFEDGYRKAIQDVEKIIYEMQYGTKNIYPVCHGCCVGIRKEITKLKGGRIV